MESSDSEDDLPLSSTLAAVRPPDNSYPQIPEDSNSETEAEQPGVREMITKAIDTMDNVSSVSDQFFFWLLYYLCTDTALLHVGGLCVVLMKG